MGVARRVRTAPPNARRIDVVVVEDDVLGFEADVLALKHARAYYGADAAVANRLLIAGVPSDQLSPRTGEARLVESHGAVGSGSVLFLGVETLSDFGYQGIREFSRRALEELARRAPETSHLAMTVHGPGYGLDEVEAFEAEVAGLIDALTVGHHPPALRRISVVERNPRRAARLRKALPRLLPRGSVAEAELGEYLKDLDEGATEHFRSVGYASEGKPTVFVAMPFAEDMLDIYEYGIERAVHAAGFLCERADTDAFTGEVLEWIKARIRGAALVVADLSMANPNVYLEVGYAWGCGITTVLVARKSEQLRFDVQGHKCLYYGRIGELEKALASELAGLRSPRPGRRG
jgi:hypothetical protein